jgi:glycosyltransferase involved in cell wall biosynthesis
MKDWTLYFVVPRIDRIGGYERQSATLAQALLRLGQPLRILTDRPAHCLKMLPPPVRACCQSITATSPVGVYRAFSRAFRSGPAVVHVHALYRFSAIAILAALRQRVPVLLLLPSSTDVQTLFQPRRFSLRLFQPALQRIDRFICPSRQIAEALQPYLKRREAAVYVPNGVDTGRFAPASDAQRRSLRQKLGIPFAKVIVFVGRHVALKGGDVLLRAFARCRAGLPPDTGLVFVGDGDQKASWQLLARDLGLETAALFVGIQAEPEGFYQAADAFVLPSLREGMPNALLEAMASGLPCLASDTGGIRDVLAERFPEQLVQPGNADALASALASLLRSETAALGEQMRAHVKAHFSADVISQRLMELYKELLQSSPLIQ